MDSFDFKPRQRPSRQHPEKTAPKPTQNHSSDSYSLTQDSLPPPSIMAALKAKGWKGLLVGVLLGLGLIYVVWGVIVINSGPLSGDPKAVPAIFGYIPGSSVVIEGNNGAFTLWRVGLGVLIMAAIALLAIPLVKRFRNKWAVGVLTFLVIGNGSWVLPQYDRWFAGYNQYVYRYSSLAVYNEKQGSLTNQQGKMSEKDLRAQALNQVVTFQYSEQQAKKYAISVSKDEIDKAYAEYADKAGGEKNLKQQLEDYLGWSADDYKAELRQQLLQEKLNEKLSEKFKGEADAARQELKTTKVRSYVSGLKWDTNLHNIQPN